MLRFISLLTLCAVVFLTGCEFGSSNAPTPGLDAIMQDFPGYKNAGAPVLKTWFWEHKDTATAVTAFCGNADPAKDQWIKEQWVGDLCGTANGVALLNYKHLPDDQPGFTCCGKAKLAGQ
jgi:hypothetical protein